MPSYVERLFKVTPGFRSSNSTSIPSANRNSPRTPSPFERTRAQVYATGNKWAIENFNATHN